MNKIIRQMLTPFNIISAAVFVLVFLAYVAVNQPFEVPTIVRPDDGSRNQNITVKLYFSNTTAQGFRIENRTLTIRKSDMGNLGQVAINTLFQGPKESGSLALVQQKLVAPMVMANSGHYFVDFPLTWRTLNYGASGENLLLCAVSNTLLGLNGAKDVTFLIDGQPNQSLMGHVDLSAPFDKDSCNL